MTGLCNPGKSTILFSIVNAFLNAKVIGMTPCLYYYRDHTDSDHWLKSEAGGIIVYKSYIMRVIELEDMVTRLLHILRTSVDKFSGPYNVKIINLLFPAISVRLQLIIIK